MFSDQATAICFGDNVDITRLQLRARSCTAVSSNLTTHPAWRRRSSGGRPWPRCCCPWARLRTHPPASNCAEVANDRFSLCQKPANVESSTLLFAGCLQVGRRVLQRLQQRAGFQSSSQFVDKCPLPILHHHTKRDRITEQSNNRLANHQSNPNWI